MGELLHSMFNEAVGNDKHNRQVASAPLRIASTDMTFAGWDATLDVF